MARPVRPVAAGQTPVKRWSNAGQTPVKRWSNAADGPRSCLSQPVAGQTPVKRRSNPGQTPIKRWSNAGQTPVKRRPNAGQTLVKRRSNAGQTPAMAPDPACRSLSLVKPRSNAGQTPVKRWRWPPIRPVAAGATAGMYPARDRVPGGLRCGARAPSPPQPSRASDRGREPAGLVRRSSSPRSLSFHTRVVQKKSRLSRLSRAPGRAREKIRTREAIENSQLNIAPPVIRGPGRAPRRGPSKGIDLERDLGRG